MQVAIALLLLAAAGLLLAVDLLPSDPAVVAHLAAHGVLWVGATIWLARLPGVRSRARPLVRIAGAAAATALLCAPITAVTLAGYAFHDIVVSVDRTGDQYGPEYPPGPKVLLRTRGDPSEREYYFRTLIMGVFLGPGRTPYRG